MWLLADRVNGPGSGLLVALTLVAGLGLAAPVAAHGSVAAQTSFDDPIAPLVLQLDPRLGGVWDDVAEGYGPIAEGGPAALLEACGCWGPLADPVRDILGGFMEGVSLLAAAGGPEGDPVADWSPAARSRWSDGLEEIDADMAAFESFLDSTLTGHLTEEEARAHAARFGHGESPGAFHTLGWFMAATVDRELGRETLVDGLCRPERLLLDYDLAAEVMADRDPESAPPRWSAALLDRLRVRIGRV